MGDVLVVAVLGISVLVLLLFVKACEKL